MKYLATLLLWLLATAAQAKCYNRGLTIWPSAGVVPANAVFMVEGMDESQQLVRGLGGAYTAYLQAGQERIALRVAETLVGQVQLTQVILKPARRLQPGRRYELVIAERSKPRINLISQHNAGTWAVAYTVAATPDHTAPVWLDMPKLQAAHYEEMGCGPEIFVRFAARV
ncbi:hypothetical protein [Hymenobacter latericus]|uniref:hypothetical protein n=1 Tax=Hymenobacter sp. YIM 151858-1 TaxID=2987688 RepID=UPI002226CDF2|nr:hypothetical protein [Hymenobacter sp. YIM 151858-1]UYZ57523.1 hypothetical protein OIS50_10625 [Hymenobacter sp. YIM 151858-1]